MTVEPSSAPLPLGRTPRAIGGCSSSPNGHPLPRAVTTTLLLIRASPILAVPSSAPHHSDCDPPRASGPTASAPPSTRAGGEGRQLPRSARPAARLPDNRSPTPGGRRGRERGDRWATSDLKRSANRVTRTKHKLGSTLVKEQQPKLPARRRPCAATPGGAGVARKCSEKNLLQIVPIPADTAQVVTDARGSSWWLGQNVAKDKSWPDCFPS